MSGLGLVPKPKSLTGTAGFSGQVSIDPQSPQWITVGQIACPAKLIYFGTDGTNNTNLSQIFVHACHEISAFVSLEIGDQVTNYSPSVTGQYVGCLAIETADGTQTSQPFTTVRGGLWDSSHIGRGLAMSHFRWTYDATKLASGLPSNIQFVVKGIKVYDPRRDTSVGGSGSMRANDQTTWAYTVGGVDIGRNPALIELTYRLGWAKNGLLWAGMGENAANIDMSSYIAAANTCDETVNGKPRYRIDTTLSLAETHNNNLSAIHATCGGRSTDVGGLIGFWVAHDDTATAIMTLTDDDVVGDENWQPLPESLRNTARGNFIDPANSYAAQPYADVAPADLRAMDNYVELVDGIDFGGVLDVDQARRVASIRIRESRQGAYSAPFALKTLGLKPTQIVYRTSARKGWTNKPFRVESMGLAIDKVSLTLSAVQSSDYADVANVTPTTTADLQTLGYIPILGALASQNGVDWSTQVAGSGKPENNADVTAAHTAADTSAVGGVPAGTVNTNISTAQTTANTGVTNAAAAQSTANAASTAASGAQTDANVGKNFANDVADNNKFSKDEKKRYIDWINGLSTSVPALVAQLTSYQLGARASSLGAAYTNFINYMVSVGYSDLSTSTTITRSTFRATVAAFTDQLQASADDLSAKAAALGAGQNNLITDSDFQRVVSGSPDWQSVSAGDWEVQDAPDGRRIVAIGSHPSPEAVLVAPTFRIQSGDRVDIDVEIFNDYAGLGSYGVYANLFDGAGTYVGTYAPVSESGAAPGWHTLRGSLISPVDGAGYLYLHKVGASNTFFRKPQAFFVPGNASYNDVNGRLTAARGLYTSGAVGARSTVSTLATATDQGGGSGVHIQMAAHTRKIPGVSGAESISYPSEDWYYLSYSTTYFIGFNDPNMNGTGSPFITTNADDLIGAGIYHADTITTPASGGSPASGGGGAGSGGAPAGGGPGSWLP